VRGKVEYADKGTLFLDEIGELPMNLQVKILRFLQEMVIQRVGGRKDIEVNVRIIAATNVDLPQAIEEGAFREDLYYRLSVVNLHLPPLRDRGEDVRLLAEHFLRRLTGDMHREITGFTPEALAYLTSYDWPGNIRELENKVRRAIVLAGGSRITPEDLGFVGHGTRGNGETPPLSGTLREARAGLEKKMVKSALTRCQGNILKASEELGISRPTMYDLLKKHGIENWGK
jgi:two-component system NtrC family response regulator